MSEHGELGYEPDFDVEAFSQRFMLAARFLLDLDDEMRQFLAVVSAAHNVGWIIDPTRYRDSLQREGNMDDLARLVRLALPLSEAVSELRAKVGDAGRGAVT